MKTNIRGIADAIVFVTACGLLILYLSDYSVRPLSAPTFKLGQTILAGTLVIAVIVSIISQKNKP